MAVWTNSGFFATGYGAFGIGSGLNLPLYGQSAIEIIGIDPLAKLLAMASEAGARSAMPLEL